MGKAENAGVLEVQFPVVGIGASAGGLDAVKSFLQALPPKSGMAFVFVQHLSPEHESILPELLQKVAPFPVRPITDNVHLEPDNLYIIPQNKIVTAIDGVLKLAPLDKKYKKVNTIDLFFTSLGAVHQSYAVGVVLSGALSDGTVGLQVIKSYGGLTFAQDESSAMFDSMPKSAIKAGVVDFVLPPEKIAERLVTINHPFHLNYSKSEVLNTLPQQDEEIFKQILAELRARRGVDFTYYKKSTLKRRIIRRMALNRIEVPAEYLAFIRENKSEQDALYNDMLISVTQFFRDVPSFEFLCSTLLPELLSKKATEEPVRIWVAGCATGEEAYSLAICLQELLGDKAAAMKIQIFATDISEKAIAKARAGIYRQTELDGVSTSRLQQFFIKQEGGYQVSKSIRDLCVFAHHNLLKDPPFSNIDFISCRNVMIYLEPVLQKRAFTTFHYSLVDDGYLMLGKSENTGDSHSDIFETYNNAERIYRRKGPVGRFMSVSSPGRERSFREIDKNVQKESADKDIFKIADEAILLNFMPPAVLVNEKFDIIQFRGITETWLVHPTGRPNNNLLKMAREGLFFELRNLLHQANTTNLPAFKSAVQFKLNNIPYFVDIRVIPLVGTLEPYYLIIFQNALPGGLPTPAKPRGRGGNGYTVNELRIEQLEKQLIGMRADVSAITEAQEATNEELLTANEELLSGSEELQSLNEELETSKEELQSINEEIMSVNSELVDRNEQLNNARLYADGIVNTIRDPLIILDKDLRVKRATGGFYRKFRMSEQETEGHFIYELSNHQWNNPQLVELLENVLPAKKELADIEISLTFPFIGKRTMYLNARQIDYVNEETLILLAIEDVTDKRKVEEGLAEAERALVESRERLRFAVDSAGLGTWDYHPQANKLECDKRSREIFGVPAASSVDLHSFFGMVHPDDRERVQKKVNEALLTKNSGEFDLEYRTVAINGGTKWLMAKGRVYFDEMDLASRFIGTLLDITAQQLIDNATRELLNKKDEFISIASHELKTPITSLKAALQMAERTALQNEESKHTRLFVQKAIKQVDKLIELIRDLLDVTKIQAGKLELRKTGFIIGTLITECCEELQNNAANHELILEGALLTEIYADRNRLEQVIINLISNAIKYSPDGERVVIKVSKSDLGIKIAVTDFGIGIPKNKVEFVFDRFYRVDEASRKYSGLGLGLYISSEIVKRHNGQINIESAEGKGSTFWFIIPETLVALVEDNKPVLQ